MQFSISLIFSWSFRRTHESQLHTSIPFISSKYCEGEAAWFWSQLTLEPRAAILMAANTSVEVAKPQGSDYCQHQDIQPFIAGMFWHNSTILRFTSDSLKYLILISYISSQSSSAIYKQKHLTSSCSGKISHKIGTPFSHTTAHISSPLSLVSADTGRGGGVGLPRQGLPRAWDSLHIQPLSLQGWGVIETTQQRALY